MCALGYLPPEGEGRPIACLSAANGTFLVIANPQGRYLKRPYGMMDAFRNGRALLYSCAPLAYLIPAIQNIYFIYQTAVV